MKQVTLSEADGIYKCGNLCVCERRFAEHAEFGKLCQTIRDFKRRLGECRLDPYWKPLLRVIGQYRFDHCAAPLPFDHNATRLRDDLLGLKRHLNSCHQIFPDFAKPALELIESMSLLIASSSNNPLLEVVSSIQASKKTGRTAMLVKEARLIPLTEEILKAVGDLRRVAVIGVNGVQGAVCFDRLIVIGPTRWFPSYVFTSPRALEIDIVTYKWMNDTPDIHPIFFDSSQQTTEMMPGWNDQGHKDNEIDLQSMINPEEIIPSINWGQISHRFDDRKYSPELSDETEEVEARLYVLHGAKATYLDANEASRTTVIDIERRSKPLVRRIPNHLITVDTFILLRTSGGGEYLIPKANQLLGEHATGVREAQRRWKSLLREAVQHSSLAEVVAALKAQGSSLANEPNVRNWMSYRSIKTEDKREFQAILSLVGLAEESDEYWRKMSMIDSAHRRAGQLIRRMLLNEVLAADIERLEKLGRMDFELPDAYAGSVTAFRIEVISPETYLVPVSHLGHVVDIEEDLWQG